MSLGERVYKLRTEKSLSQGELAEMLEVSRQSISKWENNSAVPDIAKIIKLSEIFGVSLDELIKGEEVPHRIENITSTHTDKNKETVFPSRKIAGTILLCMAFLIIMFFLVAGVVFTGLILALPFLTCGILCFIRKKNIGLWCAWDVYVLFDLYMLYATGISRASVLYTFQWTYEMNYTRLVFAWIMLLSLIVMIAVTVVKLEKKPFTSEKKGIYQLIIAWSVVIVMQVLAILLGSSKIFNYIVENIATMGAIYRIVSTVLSWSRIIAFMVALVFTIRFIKMKKL